MSAWKAKRFWKEVKVLAEGEGFVIDLDGRRVKTPAKAPLVMPSRAFAQAVAGEWDAQQGEIDPDTMPFTRLANSAIDKVAVQFDEVAEMLAAYGGSDLLCYRAEGPSALVARQAARWDPLLAWSETEFAAPLVVTAGIVPVAQPEGSLAVLTGATKAFSAYELAAFHDLVAITGSLVLAFAVARGRLGAEEAFDLSRLDEHWQIEQWGADEDAAAIEAIKRADLIRAGHALELLRAA